MIGDDMKKIKVAVCDDEQSDRKNTVDLVKKYDTEMLIEVDSFPTAQSILDADSSHYDIVLLDILMPPPTGFDVAAALASRQDPPAIIFTTKSDAYAIKGYGIAIRYLQKPLEERALFKALDVAIEDISARRITFDINDTMYTVRFCDVIYIESVGHYVNINTVNKQFRVRCSIKDFIPRLPRGYFGIPHKSFIINLEHMTSATKSTVVLDCGVIVPISRGKAQAFNEAIFHYLGR